MFVDRVRIWAKAGKGGPGAVSFLREKNMPDGGPDGGNGGKGGDVILVVNPNSNNLTTYKYSPHQFAKNGNPGMGRQMSGKSGPELILEVPPGTVVSRLTPGSLKGVGLADEPAQLVPIPPHGEALEVVADLTEPGQRFVLCEGGKGGRGNMNFKSSVNQAPRRHELGIPGDTGQFLLELKSIADVGLVGYPNAGKSTLLSRLSAAHPKIAPYPFTTLTPMIGVIDYPEYKRVTMADIPGLIEGAHEGVGLGHEFLRHIERCRVLIFVIDMAGSEARDPREDFAQLRKELKLYQEELAERPFFIVANKMDLPEAEAQLKAFKKRYRHPVVPIAAESGKDLDLLKKKIFEFIQKHP
jgi:GTP-binding protein